MPPPPTKPKRKRTPGERPPKTAPADLPPQPLDDFPARLATETPVAYDRFCQYLLLPIPRNASRLGDKGLIYRWRTAHAWVERAALFDAARRKRRLHDLEDARREADLAANECDIRLRQRASELLDEAVMLHIGALAKDEDGKVALNAIKLLYQLSSVEDTRKVATLRAARDTAIAEALADPAVVAALAQLSPEKLAAMRAPQTPPPDEYAAEEGEAQADSDAVNRHDPKEGGP